MFYFPKFLSDNGKDLNGSKSKVLSPVLIEKPGSLISTSLIKEIEYQSYKSSLSNATVENFRPYGYPGQTLKLREIQ